MSWGLVLSAVVVVLPGCQSSDEREQGVVVGQLAQISPNAGEAVTTEPSPPTNPTFVVDSERDTGSSLPISTTLPPAALTTTPLAPASTKAAPNASTIVFDNSAVGLTTIAAAVPTPSSAGFDPPTAGSVPVVLATAPATAAASATIPVAVPTNPPRPATSVALVNSQSGTTATVQGVSVPIVEGWAAFTTADEVAAASSLNPAVQATLLTQLNQDPTRVFFVPTDELSSPTPSLITIAVRSGSGLTGSDAVDRLVASSVSTEAFALESRQSNQWGGLPSAQVSLSKVDGTRRYIIAASTPDGRLTVIQSSGTHADLSAVHSRLVAEVNPAQT
jgi:hypothetical protein